MNGQNVNLRGRLSLIQNELKAPKNQYNSFGKYNYRSCEDILEAVKPICNKYRTTLVIEDELKAIGERYYVMAKATLLDWDSDSFISSSAYAREEENKKGMDSAQVTGATSSYARKYALNGLFNIDDTKDFDTDEVKKQTQSSQPKQQPKQQQNQSTNLQQEIKKRTSKLIELGVDFANENTIAFIKKYNNGKNDVTQMNDQEKARYIQVLDEMIKQKGGRK